MGTIEILKNVSAVLLLLTGVCFCYQTVYLAVSLFWKEPRHKPEKPTRYAVLIAARNEEAVLPYLLQSIRAQDYPAERIGVYVVADNCTDRTAEAAEAGGAQVYRRFDRTRIGKGYALHELLEWMRRTGELDRWDAFLIFDADNLLCPDYISKINRTCSDGFAAFHGYRNTKNFGDSWISSAYALWYLHDSVHLNAARMMLGTTCAVSGTGFGFTRALLDEMGGWRFFTLTEDIEFDNWCAASGVRIGFCREAMLYDEQSATFAQSWKQHPLDAGRHSGLAALRLAPCARHPARRQNGVGELRGGDAVRLRVSAVGAVGPLGVCDGTGGGRRARPSDGARGGICRRGLWPCGDGRADACDRVAQNRRAGAEKASLRADLPAVYDDVHPGGPLRHLLQARLGADAPYRGGRHREPRRQEGVIRADFPESL